MNRIKALFLAIVSILIIQSTCTSCLKDEDDNAVHAAAETSSTGSEQDSPASAAPEEEVLNYLTENVELPQFTPIQDGEDIIVIKIKYYGFIKIRLFPDFVPNTVNNIIYQIQNKHYDNINIYKAKANFIVQTQSPKKDSSSGFWGFGGKDTDTSSLRSFSSSASYEPDEDSEVEISENLRNFRGAVGIANEKNQLYFVQEDTNNVSLESDIPDELEVKNDAYFKALAKELQLYFPENVAHKYMEVGGAPHLDNNFVVFGHVIEGLDILDAISKVEVRSNETPLRDITIEYMKIEKYSSNEIHSEILR